MDHSVLDHLMTAAMYVTAIAVAFHAGRSWDEDRKVLAEMFRRTLRRRKIQYRAFRAFR